MSLLAGLIIGGIGLAASATAGIVGGVSEANQAKFQGKVSANQRYRTGLEQLGGMQSAMVGSGVETDFRVGSSNASYDKDGDITGTTRTATDTAGLLMQQAENSILLDIDAINKGAEQQALAGYMSAFNSGLRGVSSLATQGVLANARVKPAYMQGNNLTSKQVKDQDISFWEMLRWYDGRG